MRYSLVVSVFLILIPSQVWSQAEFTIGPELVSRGEMIVLNLPVPDGDGAFQSVQAWPFADLTASYAGDELTLGAAPIDDPDPYWYVGGGGPGAAGNKDMVAFSFAEFADGSLAGQTVIFRFEVISNTLTDAHEVRARIRDFTPGSSVVAGVTIDGPGSYVVRLDTIDDPERVVRFGFEVRGVNVWPTDLASFGSVVIAPSEVVGEGTSSFGAVKGRYHD